METFEVRPKSYTVKWVKVPNNTILTWFFKPLKNSINLGIYENNNNLNGSNDINLNLNVNKVNQIPHHVFTKLPKSSSNSNLSSNLNNNSHHHHNHQNINTNINNYNGNNGVNNVNNLDTIVNHSNSTVLNDSDLSLHDKLDNQPQLIKKKWVDRCHADTLLKSTIETANDDKIYAFVFDNTFSKTKAKTILFGYELKTLTQNLQSMSDSQNLQINDNITNIPNTSKNTVKFNIDSGNRIQNRKNSRGKNYNRNNNVKSKTINNTSQTDTTKILNMNGVQILEGFLMKKKRRKGSGKNFIKRFFSLNLTYSILYYYSNNNSNTIRGSMMITTTVISADSSDLMLYLDSGMEQWILKATSKKDFKIWIDAFNFIKKQNIANNSLKNDTSTKKTSLIPALSNIKGSSLYMNSAILSDNDLTSNDDFEGISGGNKRNKQFDVLHDKIDELKNCVQDIIIEEGYHSDLESSDINSTANNNKGLGLISNSLPNSSHSLASPESNGSNTMTRKLSRSSLIDNTASQSQYQSSDSLMRKSSFFSKFKKKSSNQALESNNSINNYSSNKNSPLVNTPKSESSSMKSVPCSPVLTPVTNTIRKHSKKSNNNLKLSMILEKIIELENEYDALYKQEIGDNSLSRTNTISKSILSQEFYDALEFVDETELGVVMLNDESVQSDNTIVTDKIESFEKNLENIKAISTNNTSSEEEEEEEEEEYEQIKRDQALINSSADEKAVSNTEANLYPLPFEKPYKFRTDIKPAACEPPSLISILRKGIGKDITSISMPVSTNEPLSFLQKYTESLEYCKLIDDAINSPIETGERILKISIFAISFLSAYKDKVRSIRKPFNPFLGETFELIHPDLNIRVISEKVVHKPFIMATHVDSSNWAIDHCISPQQKFYGKTAELIVDGKLKLNLKDTNEIYEWNQPNTIMRNIVSLTGEKYTEPVDNIIIRSNNGFKCIVNFISENGRFTSSRSEKVEFKVFKNNKELPLNASGTWTSNIKTNSGKVIWKISDELPKHEKKYGFTKFSCMLNHIDEVHLGCAPTDSRYRPDQKLYEDGKVDKADELKLKLEEDQRLRRKDSHGNEVKHNPKFFENIGNDVTELNWKFIIGEKGYWSRRERQDWDDLVKLW